MFLFRCHKKKKKKKVPRDIDTFSELHFSCRFAGAPCLSFDILPDGLGDNRSEFPHTMYLVCGTQAERLHANHIIVMKMSNLRKNKQENEDDDDDSDEDSDEDEDEKPELESAMLKHNGGTNRLRVSSQWVSTPETNCNSSGPEWQFVLFGTNANLSLAWMGFYALNEYKKTILGSFTSLFPCYENRVSCPCAVSAKTLFQCLQQCHFNGKQLAASWSELGKVHIWDLTRPLEAVNDSSEMATYTRNQESPPPVFTFTGHQTEGFAMDWSKTTPGKNVQKKTTLAVL